MTDDVRDLGLRDTTRAVEYLERVSASDGELLLGYAALQRRSMPVNARRGGDAPLSSRLGWLGASTGKAAAVIDDSRDTNPRSRS